MSRTVSSFLSIKNQLWLEDQSSLAIGGPKIIWGLITESPNSLSKRRKEHTGKDHPHNISQPRNERKELCSKQGIQLPFGSKMLPRNKPVKKQKPQLMLFSNTSQVLFKHSLCFLLQLFDKVQYHFQNNEKIKILETLQKWNYMAHSLDLANIFLPTMLSFAKI